MSSTLSSFISRAFSVTTGALSTFQIVDMTLSFNRTYRTYESHVSYSFEPLLERADRVFSEDDLVVIEHVVDVYIGVGSHRHTLYVARREDQVLFRRGLDDQRLVVPAEILRNRHERLRLVVVESEAVHHDQGAFAQSLGKRRFQRAALHLGRHLRRPVAWLPAVDGAAALSERRTQARNAAAPGAVLLPELPAAPGNVAASLGPHSSLALIGQVVVDGVIDQRFVEFDAENVVAQVQLADFFVTQVFNINSWHRRPLKNSRRDQIDRAALFN